MATQQPQPSSSNMAQESSTSYVSTTLRLSYKIPVLVRLRSAVFSIARFLRIMSDDNSHNAPEFLPIREGYRYIDSYRDRLRSLYTEPNMQRDYNRWKMTELRTFKDKKNRYRHEYIIATLTDGKGKVHLRMERQMQDSVTKSIVNNVAGRASPPTDSDNGEPAGTLTKDQEPDSFTKKARDAISFCSDNQLENDKQNRRKKALVEHIQFPADTRISLPELVLLACATNQQSKTYHITKRNCYWFCYTIAEALKKRYSHDLVPIKGRSQQGTWGNMNVKKFYDNINIDDLLATTDRLWEEFTTQIENIINNPNNKYIVKANERAEEEARLRKEEARLRGEAERRAEEEKRRAEEEKRRAEEALRRIAELEAQIAAQAKAVTVTQS